MSVGMVLSPPIRSGDLEANQKSREFSPIPNKVAVDLTCFIVVITSVHFLDFA